MASSSKNRLSAQEKRRRTFAKKKKQREKQYQRDLKTLKQYGIYSPSSSELTSHRKTQINKRMAEYREYLNKEDYFFIPLKVKMPERARKIIKDLDMPGTQKGLFYKKSGHRRAVIRPSKTHPGEYEIKFIGRYKYGNRKGKKIDEILPLAKLDHLLLEKDRFKKMAGSFGKLKKNEYLAFKIIANDPAALSKNLYMDIDSLLKDLENYQKNAAEKLAFFRHVMIVKTTVADWRKEKAEYKAIMGTRKKRKKKFNPMLYGRE